MPPREDMILFLDLETTGVDEDRDDIIEVGLSMVSTEEGYPEIGHFNRVIFPSDGAFLRLMDKKVVREMHEANGLLAEILRLRDDDASLDSMRSNLRDVAQTDILEWLGLFTKGDTTHIPLAGSGVLHFDRKFIKKQLPRLDTRLTHWAYDVGVLRRSFIKAGVKYASMDGKTHRALDDARVHADEWRYYQRVIGGLERND